MYFLVSRSFRIAIIWYTITFCFHLFSSSAKKTDNFFFVVPDSQHFLSEFHFLFPRNIDIKASKSLINRNFVLFHDTLKPIISYFCKFKLWTKYFGCLVIILMNDWRFFIAFVLAFRFLIFRFATEPRRLLFILIFSQIKANYILLRKCCSSSQNDIRID